MQKDRQGEFAQRMADIFGDWAGKGWDIQNFDSTREKVICCPFIGPITAELIANFTAIGLNSSVSASERVDKWLRTVSPYIAKVQGLNLDTIRFSFFNMPAIEYTGRVLVGERSEA